MNTGGPRAPSWPICARRPCDGRSGSRTPSRRSRGCARRTGEPLARDRSPDSRGADLPAGTYGGDPHQPGARSPRLPSPSTREVAMITSPTTAVVVYDPERADPEKLALAGILGGYRGLTRDAYALDLRQFASFCEVRHLGCAMSADPTSRPTDESSRCGAVRGRPSLGGCAPSPAPTATPRRKGCSCTPRPSMSANRALTTSRTPSALTETRSGAAHRGWARSGGRARADLVARAERPAGVRSDRRRHRGTRPRARAPDAHDPAQGRKHGDSSNGAAYGPGR